MQKESQLKEIRRRLRSSMLSFKMWALSHCNPSDNHAPIRPLRIYPELDQLSQSFWDFIQYVPPESWTKREVKQIEQLVRLDWNDKALLERIESSDLALVIGLNFPTQVIRMYMLMNVRILADSATRLMILLSFLYHDASDAVKDIALEKLAVEKWTGTEEAARVWWHSGDTTKRMAALQALKLFESGLLPEFLCKAKESGDLSLERYARAIEDILRVCGS